MKFYSREKELEKLNNLYEKEDSTLVAITSKKRVGKTTLAKKFIQDKKSIYLFVSRVSEEILVKQYVSMIKETFNYEIDGEVKSFRKYLKY